MFKVLCVVIDRILGFYVLNLVNDKFIFIFGDNFFCVYLDLSLSNY